MTDDHDHESLTLSVPSDPRVLPAVRGLVEAAARMAGLDESRRYEVVLAVNEACSNVIHHAHGGRQQLRMIITCRVVDGGLEVRLRDQGPPFDLSAVPELDPTEVRQGGRGVLLIRRFMDDVTTSTPVGGGNELRMFKRAAAATP